MCPLRTSSRHLLAAPAEAITVACQVPGRGSSGDKAHGPAGWWAGRLHSRLHPTLRTETFERNLEASKDLACDADETRDGEDQSVRGWLLRVLPRPGHIWEYIYIDSFQFQCTPPSYYASKTQSAPNGFHSPTSTWSGPQCIVLRGEDLPPCCSTAPARPRHGA